MIGLRRNRDRSKRIPEASVDLDAIAGSCYWVGRLRASFVSIIGPVVSCSAQSRPWYRNHTCLLGGLHTFAVSLNSNRYGSNGNFI
jgi:hypothetical protein